MKREDIEKRLIAINEELEAQKHGSASASVSAKLEDEKEQLLKDLEALDVPVAPTPPAPPAPPKPPAAPAMPKVNTNKVPETSERSELLNQIVTTPVKLRNANDRKLAGKKFSNVLDEVTDRVKNGKKLRVAQERGTEEQLNDLLKKIAGLEGRLLSLLELSDDEFVRQSKTDREKGREAQAETVTKAASLKLSCDVPYRKAIELFNSVEKAINDMELDGNTSKENLEELKVLKSKVLSKKIEIKRTIDSLSSFKHPSFPTNAELEAQRKKIKDKITKKQNPTDLELERVKLIEGFVTLTDKTKIDEFRLKLAENAELIEDELSLEKRSIDKEMLLKDTNKLKAAAIRELAFANQGIEEAELEKIFQEKLAAVKSIHVKASKKSNSKGKTNAVLGITSYSINKLNDELANFENTLKTLVPNPEISALGHDVSEYESTISRLRKELAELKEQLEELRRLGTSSGSVNPELAQRQAALEKSVTKLEMDEFAEMKALIAKQSEMIARLNSDNKQLNAELRLRSEQDDANAKAASEVRLAEANELAKARAEAEQARLAQRQAEELAVKAEADAKAAREAAASAGIVITGTTKLPEGKYETKKITESLGHRLVVIRSKLESLLEVCPLVPNGAVLGNIFTSEQNASFMKGKKSLLLLNIDFMCAEYSSLNNQQKYEIDLFRSEYLILANAIDKVKNEKDVDPEFLENQIEIFKNQANELSNRVTGFANVLRKEYWTNSRFGKAKEIVGELHRKTKSAAKDPLPCIDTLNEGVATQVPPYFVSVQDTLEFKKAKVVAAFRKLEADFPSLPSDAVLGNIFDSERSQAFLQGNLSSLLLDLDFAVSSLPQFKAKKKFEVNMFVAEYQILSGLIKSIRETANLNPEELLTQVDDLISLIKNLQSNLEDFRSELCKEYWNGNRFRNMQESAKAAHAKYRRDSDFPCPCVDNLKEGGEVSSFKRIGKEELDVELKKAEIKNRIKFLEEICPVIPNGSQLGSIFSDYENARFMFRQYSNLLLNIDFIFKPLPDGNKYSADSKTQAETLKFRYEELVRLISGFKNEIEGKAFDSTEVLKKLVEFESTANTLSKECKSFVKIYTKEYWTGCSFARNCEVAEKTWSGAVHRQEVQTSVVQAAMTNPKVVLPVEVSASTAVSSGVVTTTVVTTPAAVVAMPTEAAQQSWLSAATTWFVGGSQNQGQQR